MKGEEYKVKLTDFAVKLHLLGDIEFKVRG